jgi:hypothetical protein
LHDGIQYDNLTVVATGGSSPVSFKKETIGVVGAIMKRDQVLVDGRWRDAAATRSVLR